MEVNDDAHLPNKRGAPEIIASRLTPTGNATGNKKPRSSRNGVSGVSTQRLVMLARRAEFHVRPALFHQCQADSSRREVGQVTTTVHSQVFLRQLLAALNQARNG